MENSLVSMNVNDIISRALRLIRAESYYQEENLDARQYILDALNDILSLMNATGEYCPYYNVLDFIMTPLQGTYSLGTSADSDIVLPIQIDKIDYVDILLNQYRYPVVIQDNFAFLNTTMALSISGRPSFVRINENETQQLLNFYPVPDTNYNCQLLYKKQVTYINYQDNIAFPPEYRQFLVYWLGKKANIEGGYGQWDATAESEFQRTDTILKAAVVKDYRVRSMPPYYPYPGSYFWNLGVRN